MNNLDDLRGALRSLESDAPDPDAVRRRLRDAGPRQQARSRQMRRFALPAVAAAAVVAAAVTLSIVESRSPGNRAATTPTGTTRTSTVPSTTPSSTPSSDAPTTKPTVAKPTPVALTWAFAVAAVKGYTIVRTQIAAGSQTATITVSGSSKDIGRLTVYPPAAATPSDVVRALPGRHVTVRGAAGYFRIVARKAYLAWHTSDGGWVVIEGDWAADVAQQAEVSIADSTNTAVRDPLTIDFGVGHLPATLSIAGTTFYADFGGKPHLELDLIDELPGQKTPAASAPPPS